MNRSEEVPHIRSHFRQSDDAGKLELVLRLRDVAIKLLEPVTAKVPRAMPDHIRVAYQAKGKSLNWDLHTTDAYEFCILACKTVSARIHEDEWAARVINDKPRLEAIRLLLKEMKQKEVDERVKLTDSDVISIADKMIKQHEAGKRQDLTDAEKFVITVLQAYLQALSSSQKSAAVLLDACTRALEENAVSDRAQQHILDAYAGLDADAVNTGVRFIAGRKTNSGGPIRKIIAKILKKNPAMKNPELWAAVTAKPPRGWTFVCFGNRLEAKQGQGAMMQGRFFTVCGQERKKLKQ